MSQGRLLAIGLIAVGVVLALASVLADTVLGARGTTFGWKQLLGLVVGILMVAVGILLLRQGDADYEDEEDDEEVADDSAQRN